MPSPTPDDHVDYNDDHALMRDLAAALYPDPYKQLDPMTSTGRRRQMILLGIARKQRELVELDSIPDEPALENDMPTIVNFEKTFGGQSSYSYVAIRTSDGWWYPSGSKHEGRRYRWADLVQFVRRQEPTNPDIWLVTSLDKVQ